MENFKGTKGKWKLHKHAFCCIIAEESEMVIANCGSRTSNVNPEELMAEQLANAKLIATAPELLEALQDLLKDYTDLYNSGNEGGFLMRSNIDKANEAIKKALE